MALLSAELAAQGFVAKQSLLETEGGFGDSVVQDGTAKIAAIDFNGPLEITRNTLKPYASCLLTHPVIDAARSLSDAAQGRAIAGIEVEVNPACIQLAGKPDPQTGAGRQVQHRLLHSAQPARLSGIGTGFH